MSYLQENNSENLAARITYKGRKKIAQGDFSISYFQIGDSEYDYIFSVFDGDINPAQKVLMPFDKDSQVKYPYKISESTLTGTTYGTPIQSSITTTIKNNVGAAGYVSEYIPYGTCSGTTVECGWEQVDITALNGTTELIVPSGYTFNGADFITIFMDSLCVNDVIPGSATSLVYRIVLLTTGETENTLTLDRNTPNFSGLTGYATVIRNNCTFTGLTICNGTVDVTLQQDPWILNTIWSQNPAGLDPLSNVIDEKLSGYTSNAYASTKEYFGYSTSSGQTSNSGTTITNSFNENIIVSPEEQHSLSVLHYSKANDILIDPWLTFKYEDYIDHTTDGSDYFEVYIPFLYYERTGSTVGARFFMDTTDYYINSSATDTRINQMMFRYLIDELGNRVGKIFVNHKIIVFDDQEIVAAIEYKSNRRYTLPIPKILAVPIDVKCGTYTGSTEPLLGGTGDTVFVTYLFEYTGDTGLNGLHCNYYCKLTGTTTNSDVSIKFNTEDFRFMRSTFDGTVSGYVADKFQILVQKVITGEQPDPTLWKIIDFTSEIPNHIVGDLIDPVNLRGTRFIITDDEYDAAPIYVMTDPDLLDTSTSPEFGDEQPFTGSIKLTRATDLEIMLFKINLPSTDFTTTQNPSYVVGEPKRITEAALLDDNKDVMVIAKASSPIERIGNQVLSVKIDI
jgi:hypothetical protein